MGSKLLWAAASCTLLLGAALTLAHATYHPGNWPLALAATFLCGAVSLLAFALGLAGNAVILSLPAPYGFGVIALLGVAGAQ